MERSLRSFEVKAILIQVHFNIIPLWYLNKTFSIYSLYAFVVLHTEGLKITYEIFFPQRVKVIINHHPSAFANSWPVLGYLYIYNIKIFVLSKHCLIIREQYIR